ncbi:hypothetical protein BST81_22370 [Leptolyngbya sp. 'hensonii']|uniref:peptidoglycan-binding domain-containing protein n=1 Tax=Leptolyngbya sp. 'hensonii' TaxID=1922337 RepID=UPI00094FA878|nr:peptidoglycan-binding protein [Leptolyngbya sp. 'hensonii']OLP16151.1 hypothetical protein BST81_22370 [Leptolyngbya sp. 'hensonii']
MPKIFLDGQINLTQQNPDRYETLGNLSQVEAQQLSRAVFGNGPGAELLNLLDQQYSNGTGTLIKREIALARHEGGLRFGRENPDPASGYNFGTFQIGGLDTTASESRAKYDRNLQAGLKLYQQLTGKTVDPATLTLADRDIICHLGYIYTERQRSYNGEYYANAPGRPPEAIFRDLGNPALPVNQAVELMSSGIQGGIRDIGEDVYRMQSQLVVDKQQMSQAVEQGRTLMQGTVGLGDVGADVKEIQTRLKAQGYPIQVSESFTRETQQAVMAFQRRQGLEADGVVGPNTWDALSPVSRSQQTMTPDRTPQVEQEAQNNTAMEKNVETAATSASVTTNSVETKRVSPEPAQAQAEIPNRIELPNGDRTAKHNFTIKATAQTAVNGKVVSGSPSNSIQSDAPLLRYGDRGQAVTQVQTALNQRGASIVVDGVFGAQTQRAVVGFQRSQGLEPDGIVGPSTRGALGLAQRQPGQSPLSVQQTQATATNPSLKLDRLRIPAGNTYYGAPRDGGNRQHAGTDTYNPAQDGRTEAAKSSLGGIILKVEVQRDAGGNPVGYGSYIDIYNPTLGVVERIAEFDTPKFSPADVGKVIPAGTVVGTGASLTEVIHREVRPYAIYRQGPNSQYGFAGTVDWADFMVRNGIYKLEGNDLVPTGRVLPAQQIEKIQASLTPEVQADVDNVIAQGTPQDIPFALADHLSEQTTLLDMLSLDSKNDSLNSEAQQNRQAVLQPSNSLSQASTQACQQTSGMELD